LRFETAYAESQLMTATYNPPPRAGEVRLSPLERATLTGPDPVFNNTTAV